MDFFIVLLLFLAVPAGLVDIVCYARLPPTSYVKARGFNKFRANYVLVFSLMMAGDWLQGPYIYHLYEHYGFSVKDIGRLFIMGFGGSMVVGTLAGTMADKYGRKKAALLYVVSYSLSCLTKHFPNYWVLMAGRLLGGVSTSLLFSVFEAWVVAQHHHHGYDPTLLNSLFTRAVYLGNGVMAILAGLVGNVLVVNMKLGPVAPFDAAILVLLIGGVVISLTWSENYGQFSGAGGGVVDNLTEAWELMRADRRIMLLGAMQALFEAAMYAFVFLWTPALSPSGEVIPHGVIFAIFMCAAMVGTALTKVLMTKWKVETYMLGVFLVSALSLWIPALVHGRLSGPGALSRKSSPGTLGWSTYIQTLSFCVFEMMIGVFWPSMMALRAQVVPEEKRATIMNIFRVPLNLFVCAIMWRVSDVPIAHMFNLCCILLLMAALCVVQLRWLLPADAGRLRGRGIKKLSEEDRRFQLHIQAEAGGACDTADDWSVIRGDVGHFAGLVARPRSDYGLSPRASMRGCRDKEGLPIRLWSE